MVAVSAPPIESRQTWRANPLVTPAGPIGLPTQECWLHHTAAAGLHGAAGMRVLQANAKSRGYVDFEYTWTVDNPTGVIYESRGIGKNTAATLNHNTISHAICVMGNFMTEQPSEAVLNSVAHLVAWMHSKGWIVGLITGPHRDASGNSTACCGNNLIAKIPEINRRAQALLNNPAPVPAPPTTDTDPEEELMIVLPQTGIDSSGKPNGRTPTARIVKAYDCVILEDGGRCEGDTQVGTDKSTHVYIPKSLPPGSHIVGVAKVEGQRMLIARYNYPNGDSGTYGAKLP
jgi:hypothetical protein